MRNNSETFSFSGRIRSGMHAVAGIVEMLRSQHNAWVHLVASVVVIVAGWLYGVSATQWCFLILVMMAVWVAEALNTAFELLCDVASPEFHPLVKKSKDVAAGAVLLSAVGAAVVGAIVFVPFILASW
ncbi:MAG: diacylglycerol kinase family protein [Halioglobus sp.]|nr:diacylglycerol kinase family protein [Halioglobus sp.]